MSNLSAPLQKTKICPSSSLTMTDILFLLLVKSNKLRTLYSLNLRKDIISHVVYLKIVEFAQAAKGKKNQFMASPFHGIFKGRISLTNKYTRLRPSTEFETKFSRSNKKSTFIWRFRFISEGTSIFILLWNGSVTN